MSPRRRRSPATFSAEVRIVRCPICGDRSADVKDCKTCDAKGWVATTTERMLVGLRLTWEPNR